MEVLNSPFAGNLACVPSEFNFPSLKHFFRCSGTASTGTAGFGFVSYNPFQAVFVPQSPSDWPVQYSGGFYTGSSFANAPTVGIATASSNTPYVSSLTPQQFEFRVVGAGLRVRNVTAVLNRGGTLIGLESLNHEDIDGLTEATALAQDTASRMEAASSNWSSVVYHPVEPLEINYFNVNSSPVQKILGFGFTNSISQTYEWEACVVCEVKGAVIHGLTPSESDPAGFAAVQNMTGNTASRKPFLTLDNGYRLASAAYSAAKSALRIGYAAAQVATPFVAAAPRPTRLMIM